MSFMADTHPDQAEAAVPSRGRRLPAAGPLGFSAEFRVVGIGASAGGLDACRKLLSALPARTGMAFILVQHLDPTHKSMLVDLLADHTSMVVRQAANGMELQPDHLYVIPPGSYLAVAAGILHLSQPQARHGARLPFDFLLHSLAQDLGPRAVCVILSGTGADGSRGLISVKEHHGLVVAQDPNEAEYAEMPRNAIMTGGVNRVLPVAEIPNALNTPAVIYEPDPTDTPPDWLAEVVELLRVNTAHDFTLYKPGTLERRIERRAVMASGDDNDVNHYIQTLRSDPQELSLLAKDLLINVTGFFRDPQVFKMLAEKIIPDLVRSHGPDRPIRIWTAGCSTGEEAYSLAILFREAIAAVKLGVKLQVFASDVDPDAIAIAREGLYPQTIAADVSADRITRFFSKEEHNYRVAPDLRAAVVFTVQDVLADPPFSRLDFVSCRNLLIYLGPEAQAKVVGLFSFALEQGGILLLGNSETVGGLDSRFEPISKAERIYRHTGHSRAGDHGFIRTLGESARAAPRLGQTPALSRQATLEDLCRRAVLETYAPAAVLINRKHECLYSLGPTDRYLQVVPGHPSYDLLAMARQGLRTKLRSAIQRASQENTRIVISGGQFNNDGQTAAFSIAVQPIQNDGEELLLVCFINDSRPASGRSRSGVGADPPRVAELEQELEATRTELQGAIHNLEISSEEQKAINEEALSVQEEYQSTNEELLTSKEELQSLNEELTALNSQLQETLEKSADHGSNDLQNVLYSTDVATLFLDQEPCHIRFFTPATKALFAIISWRSGAPAVRSEFAGRVMLICWPMRRMVMRTLEPIEREIEARNAACYIRRVLPYQHPGQRRGRCRHHVCRYHPPAAGFQTSFQRCQAPGGTGQRGEDPGFWTAASHDLRQPLADACFSAGIC